MPTDTSQLDPIEAGIQGARSLLNNGIMQSDLDASHFRILNLDTSNLNLSESPHNAPPIAHKWLVSYSDTTLDFSYAQPAFSDLSGNLTAAQQHEITQLGTVIAGTWLADRIGSRYVPKLDQIEAPLGPVSVANQRITLLGNPQQDQDAVNMRFVNDRLLGLNPKEAVIASTTHNEPLAGLRPLDGYAIEDGDRVLVKNQAHPSENGIYIAHPGTWFPAPDADTLDELLRAAVFVQNGDTLSGTLWYQGTNPINPGDPIIWIIFESNIGTDAGAGLGQSGRTIFAIGTPDRISIGAGIDIDANYAGQTSIDTLGTVTTGIWNASTIDGEHGGTGVNNSGKHISLVGDFTTLLGLGAPIGSYLSFTLLGSTALSLPVSGIVATRNGVETFTNKSIDASQITGTLPFDHGGTNAASAVEALTNLLPSQIGHGGQVLHTDGLNVFWA